MAKNEAPKTAITPTRSDDYAEWYQQVVRAGDMVRRGQVIGHIGATGRATGPHLHWTLNWFQVKLDPSRSTHKPAPDPL